MSEVELAEQSDRARGLVRQGQVKEAEALLAQARERFKDKPWFLGKLERLEALIKRDAECAPRDALQRHENEPSTISLIRIGLLRGRDGVRRGTSIHAAQLEEDRGRRS